MCVRVCDPDTISRYWRYTTRHGYRASARRTRRDLASTNVYTIRVRLYGVYAVHRVHRISILGRTPLQTPLMQACGTRSAAQCGLLEYTTRYNYTFTPKLQTFRSREFSQTLTATGLAPRFSSSPLASKCLPSSQLDIPANDNSGCGGSLCRK